MLSATMGALRSSVKRARSSSRSPSTSSSSSSSSQERTGRDRLPVAVAAFIFRRDFRVTDNLAFLSLYEAAKKASLPILPLFFFNPRQADADKNPYFGAASFQFLCESLVDLNDHQLGGKLVCLRGSDMECLNAIEKEKVQIRMLGYNADFTPFARLRDRHLRSHCVSKSVEVYTTMADFSLVGSFEAVMTGTAGDQPYSVFTPFYRRLMADITSKKCTVSPVQPAPPTAALQQQIWPDGPSRLGVQGRRRRRVPPIDPALAFTPMPHVTDHGGRARGLPLLQHMAQYTHYGDERDDIPGDHTTHWSPHLKFGTISIRECWHAVKAAHGTSHALARQLIWREFYSMLLYHHPQLVAGQLSSPSDDTFALQKGGMEEKGKTITKRSVKKMKNESDGKEEGEQHEEEEEEKDGALPTSTECKQNEPFQRKYLHFQWEWKPEHLEAFKAGRTGVPLVDASVRCLTRTGWCPNRCRMIIANYLVKTLGVDWREGEKWYATLAVDYDVANNSGGWLWSSGQGADAQPFFRTFNPFRQSERFDKNGVFIRRWVPELAKVSTPVLHHWEEHCLAVLSSTSKATSASAKPVKQSPTEKKEVEDALKVYLAPIVPTRLSTLAVIDSFKKYNASEMSTNT